MSAGDGRQVHSSARASHVPGLLQALFAAELVAPSRVVWLVSPWISDIPILENRTHAFLTLAPDWGAEHIRLSAVLRRLLEGRTTLHVATRPDAHNRPFLEVLRAHGQGRRLRIHEEKDLHEKGILGDGYYLSGSMNFTYNGITVNEEFVHFSTAPGVVAEQQLVLTRRWGGALP